MYLTIAIAIIAFLLVLYAIFLFIGHRTQLRYAKLGREAQQKYWTPDHEEKEHLQEKGLNDLSWDELLRLLHLACLEMLSEGAGREQLMLEGQLEEASQDAPPGENRDLILRLVTRLHSDASPYKPCTGAVWQSKHIKPEEREPDIKGILRNASLTHLGCIEVIRFDDKKNPTELSFISYDELHQAIFKTGGLFRLADLEFNDGRPKEEMLVPLQYGISWATPNSFDSDGSYTRFMRSKTEYHGFTRG
jgi:hypothetical protein